MFDYHSFQKINDKDLEKIFNQNEIVGLGNEKDEIGERYVFEVEFKDEIKKAIHFLYSVFSFFENDSFNCEINFSTNSFNIITFILIFIIYCQWINFNCPRNKLNYQNNIKSFFCKIYY